MNETADKRDDGRNTIEEQPKRRVFGKTTTGAALILGGLAGWFGHQARDAATPATPQAQVEPAGRTEVKETAAAAPTTPATAPAEPAKPVAAATEKPVTPTVAPKAPAAPVVAEKPVAEAKPTPLSAEERLQISGAKKIQAGMNLENVTRPDDKGPVDPNKLTPEEYEALLTGVKVGGFRVVHIPGEDTSVVVHVFGSWSAARPPVLAVAWRNVETERNDRVVRGEEFFKLNELQRAGTDIATYNGNNGRQGQYHVSPEKTANERYATFDRLGQQSAGRGGRQ